MNEDYFAWADRKTRPRERVRKELEQTVEITVQPWKYEVKESRLSDTGINRLRGLTRSKP